MSYSTREPVTYPTQQFEYFTKTCTKYRHKHLTSRI